MKMRALLILLLALSAAGCAHRPPADLAFDRAEDLRVWTLNGRFGYRTAADGGSASLEWEQQARRGRLHFSGPLGFGSAELSWSRQGARLQHGRRQYQAASPGELAFTLTGLWLPVEALQYWVRGLPWPEAPAQAIHNERGELVQLQQLGWDLDFDRHQPVAGLSLPHRIRARHEQDRFTLLIQRWNPAP